MPTDQTLTSILPPATRFLTTYAVTAPVLSMPFHRTSEYLQMDRLTEPGMRCRMKCISTQISQWPLTPPPMAAVMFGETYGATQFRWLSGVRIWVSSL